VAQRWETSADGLTWIFHLRPALAWSDGKKLTAEDFVWSFRRALAPDTASPEAEVLYPIAGAEALNQGQATDPSTLGVSAPDLDTLKITLASPTPFLTGILALMVAAPVPRQAIEQAGAEWARPGSIVSNGAFVMTGWTPQLEVVLARNPHYWNADKIRLDGVRWVTMEDKETSLRLFQNGELDIAVVGQQDVKRLRRDLPDSLRTDTTLRTDYLVVNTDVKPFDDIRVRRALSMAIDRDVIAGKIDPHGQKPATGLVPPGMEGYTPQTPDWAAWPMGERLDKAKALLQEAGFDATHRLHVDLTYATDDGHRLTLAAIAGMWHRIGVDASVENQENRVFNAALRDRQEMVAYTDWIADFADPLSFLATLDSASVQENNGDYRNRDYDSLLARAAATLDPAARMVLLEAAEKLADDEAPVIPIAYETRPVLVSPKLHGYIGNPLESYLSRDLWLDN
jgi:oligopeptide transport system substrate-binding protein